MKSIVTINTEIPGLKNYYDFKSGGSISDYDIVVFDPTLPYYGRHSFSDGSSAIDRVSGQDARTHLSHWSSEMHEALKDGKTVFFLLATKIVDSYVTGIASSTSKTTNYNTSSLSNYDSAPISINLSNSKGTKYKVNDGRYRPLFDILKDCVNYEAYLRDEYIKEPTVSTISGHKALGATYRAADCQGNLVILPYFNLSEMLEKNDDGESIWTAKALGVGTKLTKALIELDKTLRSGSDKTPTPDWVENINISLNIKSKLSELDRIQENIEKYNIQRTNKIIEIDLAKSPQRLLFETGTELELSIESFLQSLDYKVTNFREGSLEIDHIILSPEGKRMIGEAEGKDNSAISITKFRQLESNINEDFEREEVDEPASGILFGNGYRFKKPEDRELQFTDKCLINAKRLSTVLIQTSDLYPIAMYIQDNPDDNDYKKVCRSVIESASGEVAVFPFPLSKAKEREELFTQDGDGEHREPY